MQGLAEFFEHGGLFMYFNVLCSAAVIAVIVERIIFFPPHDAQLPRWHARMLDLCTSLARAAETVLRRAA